MNCIACVQTIKNVIGQTEGVVGTSTVILETGEAYVKTKTWDETVPLLTRRITNIGFQTDMKKDLDL